ncbi:PfpI endopeptidase-like protein [Amylocarpus encephaloides]|uniref:PfpI endopeptidase-like protein n=1 Tax=Amylocarpus encephaloides TaxID=45428 RepID=A0A9P7YRZ4_9HELO|nr:PfpI endopeptidase-like protein [Amylocarpus encephaloides]
MASQKKLRIGVYCPGSTQLLDLSCVDIFGMLDPSYLGGLGLPSSVVDLGVPCEINYISAPKMEEDHIELTANAFLRATKTIKDTDVQPGMLDIVLVPGPDPSEIFPEDILDFVRGHANFKGSDGRTTEILSVCTGCSLLAQAGLLNGKRSSGPRGLIPMLKKKYPAIKWDDSKRWVHEGTFWSSGGITNGQEMVAAYLRHNYPSPTTEMVLAMADVGEKGIDYSQSKAGMNIWFVFQIIRAGLFCGGKRTKVL